MTSSRLYLRLLGNVKPYWRIFALSILGMVVAAITEPLLPVLLKTMLDGTFVNKDEAVIRLMPLAILAIFFCTWTGYLCCQLHNYLGGEQGGGRLA